MHIRLKQFFFVMLSLLALSVSAQEGVLVLSNEQGSVSAGRFLEVYEDVSGRLNVDSVSGPDVAFYSSQKEILRFGFTESAVWARLTVRNDSSHYEWWLGAGQPNTESVILYQRTPGDGWQERRLGLAEPFESHEMDHRANIFHVIIPPGESRTYYLQVKSRTALSLSVQLWQPATFVEAASLSSMFIGGVFSILLSVCVYSLLASLLYRNVLYLQFSLFVICAIIFSFSYKGFIHQYSGIPPGDWSIRIIAISSALLNLFYLIYIRHFLQSKYHAFRLDRLLLGQIGLILIAIAMSIWGDYSFSAQMIFLLTLLSCLMSFCISVFICFRGYRPACLLVSAQLILLPVVGLTVAFMFGAFPKVQTEIVSFVAISVVIPMLAVSFNSRIKVLGKESEFAQQRALEVERSMVRELEHQVIVRTEKLQEASAQAEAASHAKGEFLAVMSHEMRTPMTSIIGAAELLDSTNMSDENKYLVNTINGACNHLLILIDDVLDLSKIESSSLSLKSEVFLLQRLLEEVVALMHIPAREKGLQLTLKTDIIRERCLGDQGRLRQIIINLIANAIKYSDAGEIIVRAELLESSAAVMPIYISVEDSGCGIAPHLQARIFEPFEQLDGGSVRHSGGAGLGLAICKRLVEAMNGTISVESRLGDGSLFWFTVDLLQPENDKALSSISYKAINPLRILLVEDTQASREVLKLVLTREGHSVIAVATGEEAVGVCVAQRFDLVLMDLQLPGMNGFEAAGLIWQESDLVYGEFPIFALTASSTREMEARCRMAGFRALVGKPLSLQELYGAIACFTDIPILRIDEDSSLLNQCLMDDYRRCLSADELATMIDVVMRGLIEEEKRLDIAWKSKDFMSLAAIAHKVAGSAGLACFTEFSDIALQLESAAVANDLDKVSTLMVELKKIRMTL